jgi:hypothetical protein
MPSLFSNPDYRTPCINFFITGYNKAEITPKPTATTVNNQKK